MDREQRIEELRAEIAVHERVIEDGEAGCYMNITGPDDEKRACRRYEKHRKSVPSDQAKTESLAEVRAELSALEQREPTIEERFPVGSRWRRNFVSINGVYPLVVVTRVRQGEVDYRYEEDGTPNERTFEAFLYAFTRIDDTPPAQPVDPRNICDEGFMFCGDCAPCRDLVASAPTKPAPTCEAPGWLGPQHPVDADEYLVCRTCRASESDRRRERRRVFDRRYVAAVETVLVPHREEPESPVRCEERWRAVLGTHASIGPTEPEAANALFEKMERAR
jgi:hypothetical protein